ncbi:hypothetical protein [Thiomonas sp. FB-6]|uniref:hypothetical protein n=1 Tax=Thiomonas sp. FB-6 TaxID=1158291 RepID=UPI0003814C9B|nr:hypothetical protein [Thiomonas sp. FB-6]
MHRVIQIEPGSRFIAAWELGLRIGALLHPTPDTPPLLVTLQKKIAEGEPNNVRIEELSDADVQYLRATWKDIGIPDALNMTQEQWALCNAAFQAAADRPQWDLVPRFKNYVQDAKSEHGRIANKHVQAMNALITAGRMRAYDADLAPVQKVDSWGSQVPVEDARAYLAGLGIELREQVPAPRRTIIDTLAAMNQSIEQQAAEALADGYRPPEGPYRHALPVGKRHFTVYEATLETALAVHPRQADDLGAAKVKGFLLHEVGRPQQGVYPSDEQARELDDIWNSAALPRPAFPMERYTFDAYVLALSQSARGSEWALGANLTSRETHAGVLRAATCKAHEEMLRQAVAAGTVTLLHPGTLTPIGAAAAGENALIRREDLVKFAADMPDPIELVDAETAAQSIAPEPAAPDVDVQRSAPAEQGTASFEPSAGDCDSGASPEPALLSTAQIATAFGGAWMGAATLHTYLGKRVPKWLASAIAIRAPATNKKVGHRWNPVEFAKLLREHKGVKEAAISKAFREVADLKEWSDRWGNALSALHQFDE